MPRAGLPPRSGAALDGLRGLAALMVVASHASNVRADLLPGLSLSGIGKPGVYLFFVLSAFLLTLQWLQADPVQRAQARFLGHYLWRRVLRIYPLYILVLLAGWSLPPRGLGVPLDGAAVWRHLSLQEGRELYWSVPVEFLYYLVIPLLAWWLARPWPAPWRAGGLAGTAVLAIWLYPPAQSPVNSTDLAYYLPIFFCGSGAAWLVHMRQSAAATAPTRRPWVADVALVVLLVASVPSLWIWIGLQRPVDALHREFLAWGLAWTAALWALVTGRMPLWGSVLRTRAMVACGRWCFGIYLLHLPALVLCRMLPVPVPLKGWLGLALTLVLAGLAHRWIERPAQRWGLAVLRPR